MEKNDLNSCVCVECESYESKKSAPSPFRIIACFVSHLSSIFSFLCVPSFQPLCHIHLWTLNTDFLKRWIRTEEKKTKTCEHVDGAALWLQPTIHIANLVPKDNGKRISWIFKSKLEWNIQIGRQSRICRASAATAAATIKHGSCARFESRTIPVAMPTTDIAVSNWIGAIDQLGAVKSIQFHFELYEQSE